MRNATIVLTATIRPNVDFVARADVDRRIEDYAKCISFYLQNTSQPIVFAENSGFDPNESPLFRPFLDHDRFHWQTIEPHSDLSKGKGFQEFYTLDQLVEKGLCGEYFVKITGRYLVRNAPSLIEKMKAPFHIDLHQKMKVAITGFFGVETQFYRDHLFGKYIESNDVQGRFIEHVIYDAIRDNDFSKSVELLHENAQYEGVSGSHGNSMARNPYKMKLRSLERSISRAIGINKFLIEY
ncbi:hypothetical protein O3Q51_04895 [Cryomorphaceae bacterium 1068]|nr:hypothetical protein [Cryomorphaceae bacterium 1068]